MDERRGWARELLHKSPWRAGIVLLEAAGRWQPVVMLHELMKRGGVGGLVAGEVADKLKCRPLGEIGGLRLWRLDQPLPEGPGLVCFTAGSSGRPKAILRSYRSWRRSFDVQAQMLRARPASVLVLGDPAHSLHLFGALEALERDVMPGLLPRFTPKAAIDQCQAQKAGLVYATPAHLNLLLAFAGRRQSSDCPSVRHVLTGGATFDEGRRQALRTLFPQARITEFFGTSEASYISMKTEDAPAESIGRPCPGVEVRIGERPDRPTPAGVAGPLWVKSDLLFERYVLGEDENTVWRDGFLCVGDRASRDEAGHLYYHGRAGDMAVVAGENVFLGEVERELAALAPAGEVAVLTLDDEMRGSRLVGVVEAVLGEARKADILKQLRQRLGPLKAPKELVALADWPLLPSGKTDRKRLRALLEAAT